MYETRSEVEDSQGLLDRSFGEASPHLHAIMTPERRLSAQDLCDELQSVCVLNVATVTKHGEPRISALDGHFLHGRWHFATPDDAPKAVQMLARPAVSAAYTPRDGFGVFCHGTAHRLQRGTPPFQTLYDHWVGHYGSSPDVFGPNIAYLQIEPRWLVAFAMTEQELAQIEAQRA